MKNDTELDSLLEEYQNLIDPKEKDFSIMKEEAIFWLCQINMVENQRIEMQ